ncbi:MAG: DUF2784 domain-containing protein [Planctomycetota bacterium]|jgi:hypothetical protein
MVHRALADLVLVLHLAFIAFVVAGGLLSLRWRWTPLVHLPAVLWGVFVELTGRVCPLTPLENALRRASGASGYSGGFIENYLAPIIYPAVLSRQGAILLAGLLVLVNALVYLVVWRRYRRAREMAPSQPRRPRRPSGF